MFYIEKAKREYLAKQMGELGINIMTVAFASYFFEKFPLPLRFGLCIIAIAFLLIGYIIQPSKKGV